MIVNANHRLYTNRNRQITRGEYPGRCVVRYTPLDRYPAGLSPMLDIDDTYGRWLFVLSIERKLIDVARVTDRISVTRACVYIDRAPGDR